MAFLNKKIPIKKITINVSVAYSCPEYKEQESKEAFAVIAARLSFDQLMILKKVCSNESVKNMALNLAGSYI
jgi:hypothetical protein